MIWRQNRGEKKGGRPKQTRIECQIGVVGERGEKKEGGGHEASESFASFWCGLKKCRRSAEKKELGRERESVCVSE